MYINEMIDDVMEKAVRHNDLKRTVIGNPILEEKFKEVENNATLYFTLEVGAILSNNIDTNNEIIVAKLKRLKEILYVIDMGIVAKEIEL